MSQPPMELPGRILLATDLSPRCDRAIERSLQLATQWNAGLIAVHCLETASETLLSPPIWDIPVLCGTQDSQWFAQRRLQGDLDAFGGTATIVITVGDPGPAIRDAAVKDECALIVAGPSRAASEARRAAEEQCAAFLADVEFRVPPHRVVVEYGPPEAVLRRYVRERDIELVVIGRGQRNALENVLMGNTARAILDAVGCDCLIVGNPDVEEGC